MKHVISGVGRILREQRALLGLSRSALGRKAGVSVYALRKIEEGGSVELETAEVQSIAGVLHLETDVLLRREGRRAVVGHVRVRKGKDASYENLIALLEKAAGREKPVRLLRVAASRRFRKDVRAGFDAATPDRPLNRTTRALLDPRIPWVEFLIANPFADPFLTQLDAEGLSAWRILRVRNQLLEFARGLLHLRSRLDDPSRLRLALHRSPLIWNLGILGEEEVLLRAYGEGTGHDDTTTDLQLGMGSTSPVAGSFLQYYEAIRRQRGTLWLRTEEDLDGFVASARWPSLYKGNAVRAVERHGDFDDRAFPIHERAYKVCETEASHRAEVRWLRLLRAPRSRCSSFRPARLVRERDVKCRGTAVVMRQIEGPTLFELAAELREAATRSARRRDLASRWLGFLTRLSLTALREFRDLGRTVRPDRPPRAYPYRRKLRDAIGDVAPLLTGIPRAITSDARKDATRLGKLLERAAAEPFRDAHLKNRLLMSDHPTARVATQHLLRRKFETASVETAARIHDIDFESSHLLVTPWDDVIHLLLFEHTAGSGVESVVATNELVCRWLGREALDGEEHDVLWSTVLARASREFLRRVWYARVMPRTYRERYGRESRDHLLRLAVRAGVEVGGFPHLLRLLEVLDGLGSALWGITRETIPGPALVLDPPVPPADPPLAAASTLPTEAGSDRRGIEILEGQKRVFFREHEVRFTNLEFRTLLALARRPGKVFRTDDLVIAIWGRAYHAVVEPASVKKYIHLIRQKLEGLVSMRVATRAEIDGLIENRRGVGYALHPPDRIAVIR